MTFEGSESRLTVDYLQIHAVFAETEYGQTLSQSVRYDKYRPPETSHQRWQELLGPDVNNLDHGVDTYHLCCNFIGNTERLQPMLLTARDKAVIKVGSLIHDWGESIFPDINYFEKTEADEAAERQAFIENLPNFYSADDPYVKELIDEALNEVIFDSTSRLGNIFNVIEHIGYIRTGLRADQHVREQTAPDCQEHLRWLAASVMSSDHIATLITRGRQLLAAHHFLALKQDEISQAIEDVQPEIFEIHKPDEAPARLQGLEESRIIWNAWLAGFNSALR